MTTLLIATRNEHKVDEIRAILGDRLQYLTLKDFPAAPEVIEDTDTFAGNAAKKATTLVRWLAAGAINHQLSTINFVLADDSGLEVDALDGKPGVHSARFAALDTGLAGNSSDADNCAKLLRLLMDIPPEKRTARFRCVIALTPLLPTQTENASPVCYADELALQTSLFDGTCEGRIDFAPHGTNGFGYDPLFIPTGHKESFAELSDTEKNKSSHRAKALAKLKEALAKR